MTSMQQQLINHKEQFTEQPVEYEAKARIA